jgi:hypothetical protein
VALASECRLAASTQKACGLNHSNHQLPLHH